jgi:antitoxin ChpS
LFATFAEAAMHITKLRRVGDSVMLAVPPDILAQLHLGVGDAVCLALNGERLVVESRARPHYTLDELLAKCDFSLPQSAEDREWIDAPAVGRELV